MPNIPDPRAGCTIVITVDAEAGAMPHLEEHARLGLQRFREFDGYLAGALHRSADGNRLIQYLQWETESLYQACLTDPRWDSLPSTKRFMALVEAGQVTLDVRRYDIVATVD